MVEPQAMMGSSGNDSIGTPQALYDGLNRRYGFDYDAAASHENHKAPFYSTVDGTFWQGVTQDSLLDGLEFPWKGLRVFVNPPYSRPLLGQFIDKAIEERNSAALIVMLVKVDTSTQWWKRLESYAHIDYLKRVNYEYAPDALAEMRARAEGKKGQPLPENWAPPAATFSSALALIRPDDWRPS